MDNAQKSAAYAYSNGNAPPSPRKRLSTHSAPASPLLRPGIPNGLAPLAQIIPVNLSTPQLHVSQRSGQTTQTPQEASRRPNQYFTQRAPARSTTDIRSISGKTPSSLDNRAGSSGLRMRSRSRRPIASSSSDTETEVDSDSTFVPGRSTHKHSLSQPDLVALRSRLEGWAGSVAREQAEKAAKVRSKNPPSPGISKYNRNSPHARSHPSLVGLRQSPSPRASPPLLKPMTPVLSSSSAESSPMTVGKTLPVGGMTGSEDGDDDSGMGTGTDSPSSSLSFSPKKTRLKHRISERSRSGLGLSLGPSPPSGAMEMKPEELPDIIERTLQTTLLPLRLLAIIPSAWGICVLLDALRTGGLWFNVWPWGVDLSREALERLVAGGTDEHGIWRRAHRGDMVLCIAWVRLILRKKMC